jgi:hypothetical protein
VKCVFTEGLVRIMGSTYISICPSRMIKTSSHWYCQHHYVLGVIFLYKCNAWNQLQMYSCLTFCRVSNCFMNSKVVLYMCNESAFVCSNCVCILYSLGTFKYSFQVVDRLANPCGLFPHTCENDRAQTGWGVRVELSWQMWDKFLRSEGRDGQFLQPSSLAEDI